ncbi:carboxylic ester hydrolase [Procambarus clarkii]|uniref:carboxylic ester hydrolase n=1 Tax=Procambarus clarkii TaxID=6728 RepID=UPI0037443459
MGRSVRCVIMWLVVTVALAEESEAPGDLGKDTQLGEISDVPVVTTISGEVSGVLEQSLGGKTFYSYYSIPYAEPPVGDLRFKDPVEVKKWEGIKDGSKMPPFCPQYTMISLITGRNVDLVGNEDCLFLNIFTPKPVEEYPLLPVMVYIHGGGWMSGGTLEYPPHVLLDHNIVLVTIQYRLGILGFLSTEDEAAPGNLGLKDQTLALTWVQKNIHKFGGDALKVTLFGESAGAGSVHFQILTHKALGLFQQAILQSGSALCPWSLGGAHAAVAQYIGEYFNCTTEDSHQLISCLQAVDTNKLVPLLLHFAQWHMNPLLLGPRVDGEFLVSDPATLLKDGRQKNVHLITGITQHEGALIALPMFGNEGLRSALKYNFIQNGPISLEFGEGDVSPLNQTVKIFDHYLGGIHLDVIHADNVTQMYGDRYFAVCHDLTSSLHAKNVARKKKNTYRYELRHRGQRSTADLFSLNIGQNWVSHTDELFYLFSGGPLWAPLERDEDLKLRNIITTLWTNFATTGNPTPDDSLGFTWDPITDNDFRHLALTPSPAMQDDYRQETREFWSSLPLKQNLILHPDKVLNIVYVPVEETKTEPVEEIETEPVEGTVQDQEDPTQSLDPPAQTEEYLSVKEDTEGNEAKSPEDEHKEKKDEL